MPTPPLSDELAREAYQALVAADFKANVAAASLGLIPGTFESRVKTARLRGFHLSEGARNIVAAAKLAPVEAKGGWVHSYDNDGKKIGATRWTAPDGVSEEDLLERIKAAFADIPSAPEVDRPDRVMENLCTLWPLYDVHWGMHAWGLETGGQDYDLKLAKSDLIGAFERVLQMTPFVEHAVILIGGDFFHADDNTAQTPAHAHKVDVDGRMFKTIDTAIETLSYVIQRAQSKAASVTVRVLRGNHDEHSHMLLTFALGERFRDARVTVQKDPRDLFTFQWGRTAIFAHHGDKMKPVDLVLKIADLCPFWTETRHRYAYTGHRHKMAAERIGGVHWEQLDAFCPPDAYGSTWTGRRAFKAEVFDRHSGRVLTAHDPLERV